MDASPAARALAFTILTAARSGEVLGATWSEIDIEARVWTISSERMKGGRRHRVPLSAAALAVLGPPSAVAEDRVFPIGSTAMWRLVRGMGLSCTVHGFRSSFRDWCSEETSFPAEIAEAALAHVTGDATARAYRRGDALAKRAMLMEAWGEFLGGFAASAKGAENAGCVFEAIFAAEKRP